MLLTKPASTLLYGVPTNAQIALTLLRMGEACNSPLPPIPHGKEPVDPGPAREMTADLPVTASHMEVLENSVPHDPADDESDEDGESKNKKRGRKLVGFVRKAARTTVTTVAGKDQLKAAAGSETAKDKKGVLPERTSARKAEGPYSFAGRVHGKKGTAYLDQSSSTPYLAFEIGQRLSKDAKTVFSVPLMDIMKIRKLDGLGWKTKVIADFAVRFRFYHPPFLNVRSSIWKSRTVCRSSTFMAKSTTSRRWPTGTTSSTG
jgi:hypothetical protein